MFKWMWLEFFLQTIVIKHIYEFDQHFDQLVQLT